MGRSKVEYAALQIAAISVLSPVLVAIGILYILSTANINLVAVVLNALTAVVGGLRFTVDVFQPYRLILNFLFVLFLILALTANIKVFRKFSASKAKKPRAMRIEIESPNAWVVYKESNDAMAYMVPKPFLKNHSDLAGSDCKFRITCDSDVDPIEGAFSIGDKCQIILPEHILSKLHSSQMIRFEMVE